MKRWIDYFQSKNAVIENDEVTHFGKGEASELQFSTQATISPLTQYGILCISGEDASGFIQNQFCNDIRQVTSTHSQLNGYCSPKGRVLSLFRLIFINDRYFLILQKQRLEATLQRLKMFVLMSKVNLEDVSNEYALIGCCGTNIEQSLNNVIPRLPQQVDDCCEFEQQCIIKVSDHGPLYMLLGPVENMIRNWEQLSTTSAETGQHLWSWHTIQAGIPEVYEPTAEDFVPQMLNLHSLNAVSFKKGCYPGQEVVARVHYLGKQKRRMYLGHISSERKPQAGDSLYSSLDPNGQSAGKIVSAEHAPDDGIDFLAVMQVKNVESDEQIITSSGEAVGFKDLPYTVELEGKK